MADYIESLQNLTEQFGKLESDEVCFEIENAPLTGGTLLDLIVEAAEE